MSRPPFLFFYSWVWVTRIVPLAYFNPLFNPYANLGQSETDFETGCIKQLAAQYLFGIGNLSLLAAEKDNCIQ